MFGSSKKMMKGIKKNLKIKPANIKIPKAAKMKKPARIKIQKVKLPKIKIPKF